MSTVYQKKKRKEKRKNIKKIHLIGKIPKVEIKEILCLYADKYRIFIGIS